MSRDGITEPQVLAALLKAICKCYTRDKLLYTMIGDVSYSPMIPLLISPSIHDTLANTMPELRRDTWPAQVIAVAPQKRSLTRLIGRTMAGKRRTRSKHSAIN